MKEKIASSSRWQLLVVVPVFLALTACATSGGMSFDNYRGLDPAGKTSYAADSDAEIADKLDFDKIQRKRLEAGFPVTFEVDNFKLTKIWDKDTSKLSFYEGYVTSPFGSESSLVASVITEDASPKPRIYINKVTGAPSYSVFVANVSVQETMLRAVAKGIVGWGGSALNGAVAASISKCDDCGGSGVVNIVEGAQAISGSMAGAEANTTSNAGVNTGGSPRGMSLK